MKPLRRVSIVVAYDDNRVIGNKGKIPWHLPEDMKFFKELTEGHTVIMGRGTWDSLPIQPLVHRNNIVITTSSAPLIQTREQYGLTIFKCYSLSEAMNFCDDSRKLFIIGGASIYRAALYNSDWGGVVDKIYATNVYGVHEGDRHFPLLPSDQRWVEINLGSKTTHRSMLFERTDLQGRV